MRIKAKTYYGEIKIFEVENNLPTITTTIEELLNDRSNYLWDTTSVEVGIKKLRVEQNKKTDGYNFYEIQYFNAYDYDMEIESDGISIFINEFIELRYVAVRK